MERDGKGKEGIPKAVMPSSRREAGVFQNVVIYF